MSSHQLEIAKATFAASLLRPDPSCANIAREEVTKFHNFFEATISQCSPQNVQICREWISQHIVPSGVRCAALGRYLIVASTRGGDESKSKEIARGRLHVLYLVNDLLHWLKYHDANGNSLSNLLDGLQEHLSSLVGSASAFDSENKRHHDRVSTLLTVWQENRYLTPALLEKLRKTAQEARSSGSFQHSNGQDTSISNVADGLVAGKSLPWLMPASHGDPSTPFYDLPAANLMPHIIPNSSRPIDSRRIKPLQFTPGPAEERLIVAVQGLLDDVDQMFASRGIGQGQNMDIDEMGQSIILDEFDQRVEGETYYGWSRSFAKRMQKRATSNRNSRSRSRSRSRSYSRSISRSRSRSLSPRKRRRSRSRSASSSPQRRKGRYSSSHSRSRSRSRSRGRYNSPPRQSNIPASLPPKPNQHQIPPQLPISVQPPIPPPRPANWSGPWPPPPPRSMPSMPAMPFVAPGANTFIPPPPLPNFGMFPPGMPGMPMQNMANMQNMQTMQGMMMGHIPTGIPPPPPPPPSSTNWTSQQTQDPRLRGRGRGRGSAPGGY